MRKQSRTLQYLSILNTRTNLTASEERNLRVLKKGYQAEREFDDLTKLVFKRSDLILDDLTLKYGESIVQIDKLLAVKDVLYLIDIKNYSGQYTFQNGSWFRNNRVLSHSIFGQIDRARDILLCILQDKKIQMSVKSVIIFWDPNASISIQGPTNHIIKYYTDVTFWLKHLSLLASEVENKTAWKEAVSSFQIPDSFPHYEFDSERSMTIGICCPECQNFNWDEHRFFLQCQKCDYAEAKEMAYVRTICDWGVIFFKDDLQNRLLFEFFGNNCQKHYLKIMLHKHFTPASSTLRYHYENKGDKFEYWFSDKRGYFIGIQKRVTWGRVGPANI